MKKCAVIVDNRPSEYLTGIIDRHMEHLPGWDLIHMKDKHIKNASHYNHLLTSVEFWEMLPYEKVLIFQHDSMLLCPIPKYMFDYNYVGAPWKKDVNWNTPDRRGGNGGLSIRDVEAHKKLLYNKRYNEMHGNEDVFFSHHLPNVAPYEVCAHFSVETEFQLGTIGYHAIDKYLSPEQCKLIRTQYDYLKR